MSIFFYRLGALRILFRVGSPSSALSSGRRAAPEVDSSLRFEEDEFFLGWQGYFWGNRVFRSTSQLGQDVMLSLDPNLDWPSFKRIKNSENEAREASHREQMT